MRVSTSAGVVELTGEMVCRGMVFAPKNPRDYALGETCVFVAGRRDDANDVWRDARDDSLGTNPLGADRLLGCDPAFASRADCELYGVYGDAAAHGFAPLRDGGAVDLRKPKTVAMPHDRGRTIALNPWAGDAVELEKVESGGELTTIHQSSRKPHDIGW